MFTEFTGMAGRPYVVLRRDAEKGAATADLGPREYATAVLIRLGYGNG